MVAHRSVSHRHAPRIPLLNAVVAGVLLGGTTFIGKIVLFEGITVELSFFLGLILNPLVWLAAVTGIGGFLLFQRTLHQGRVSLVPSIVGGFAVVVPVLLALFFLGEAISLFKGIGIALIVVATLGLAGH